MTDELYEKILIALIGFAVGAPVGIVTGIDINQLTGWVVCILIAFVIYKIGTYILSRI